jgi:hypothetical protein
LIHCLFAHPGTVCQLAWTYAVGPRVLQYRDMG